MKYTLAFYERGLAYGGPEEGGWWYDTGELVREFKTVDDEETAYKLANRANRLLQHLQRRKRPVSSVAYTGGRHSVDVFEGIPPGHTPEHRPYYS